MRDKRQAPVTPSGPRWLLAIHGGAGAFERERDIEGGLTVLRRALAEGQAVLASGGTALDAASAAVTRLEDSGAFNAGRGSIRASDSSISHDASVMDGRQRAAGAVAAVAGIKNPVLAARLVLEQTPHVLLAGVGAESLAASAGLAMVPPDYFVPSDAGRAPKDGGTVGAVALDQHGGLAAATSTGGTEGKLPGRVGDSAVIGAGTYADEHCAVSATGTGDVFIRAVFAFRVAAAINAGQSLTIATAAALEEVARLGGSGGCVALSARGEVAMPFNSRGMFRGVVDPTGRCDVAVWP